MARLLVSIVALTGCVGKEPDPQAAVSDVSFTQFPDEAGSGIADVCWRVEGIGRTPHTDLHLSDEPAAATAEAASVQPHQGESVLPDNAQRMPEEGYPVPGTFCARVTLDGNSTLYVVAHAVDVQHERHRFSETRPLPKS